MNQIRKSENAITLLDVSMMNTDMPKPPRSSPPKTRYYPCVIWNASDCKQAWELNAEIINSLAKTSTEMDCQPNKVAQEIDGLMGKQSIAI